MQEGSSFLNSILLQNEVAIIIATWNYKAADGWGDLKNAKSEALRFVEVCKVTGIRYITCL